MSCIFSRCSSLCQLPDISKWDTSNVIYMNGMFSLCISLSFLPDILKWDFDNVNSIDSMFNKTINCTNSFFVNINIKEIINSDSNSIQYSSDNNNE